jgi:hypothetical protein
MRLFAHVCLEMLFEVVVEISTAALCDEKNALNRRTQVVNNKSSTALLADLAR